MANQNRDQQQKSGQQQMKQPDKQGAGKMDQSKMGKQQMRDDKSKSKS